MGPNQQVHQPDGGPAPSFWFNSSPEPQAMRTEMAGPAIAMTKADDRVERPLNAIGELNLSHLLPQGTIRDGAVEHEGVDMDEIERARAVINSRVEHYLKAHPSEMYEQVAAELGVYRWRVQMVASRLGISSKTGPKPE
jgi:hypothetical protein